jgi:hypothetical protein
MRMRTLHTTLLTFAVASALPVLVHAQASAQAGGSADIEMGATRPSEVELNAGARPGGRTRDDGGVRLALQGRLDAINVLSIASPNVADLDAPGVGRRLLVPIMTPGVRLIDGRLFLGMGLGIAGATVDAGPGETSRSGFSLTPLASYDLLLDSVAALSLGGWLNFAHLGETEVCGGGGGCVEANDDATGWGLSVAAGIRGFLSRGLALGGEFGWGFLDTSVDNGADGFGHAIFGNIFLEASIGI